MQKREYQEKHIENVVEQVSLARKVLAQLPTGGGKTVEFSLIAQRFIRKYIGSENKAVLILVHREELLKQAQKTIKSVLDIDSTLITSETKHFKVSRVYIGMVESTISRLHLIHNIGLVIIDECHVNNFNKVHHLFLNEFIIGFSATPISASKKDPLNRYYNAIVTGPQIKELIALGYLAQNITRCPKEIVDVTKFGYDSLKGDYNERQMATEYKLPKYVTNVVREYHRWCFGKKTIIFNVNIEHSKEVTECFVACGIKCRHLDSDSSKRPSSVSGFKSEREEILNWFKVTEDAVLCNVMIATVGFDEPTILNVINNYSTLSLTKFIQTSGRGGRIIDEDFIQKFQHEYPYRLSIKDHFQIIDLGGNYSRFGDWSDERNWEYIFNNPSKPGYGLAPVKTCPSCDGLLHAAIKICPLKNEEGELCLHEFDKRRGMTEKEFSEMVMVTKGIDVEGITKKSKNKYLYYPFTEFAVDVVRNMFETYQYKDISDDVLERYFRIYYSICCKWYLKEFSGKEDSLESIEDSGFHISKARNNFNNLIKHKNLELPKNDIYDWKLEKRDFMSTEEFTEKVLLNG